MSYSLSMSLWRCAARPRSPVRETEVSSHATPIGGCPQPPDPVTYRAFRVAAEPGTGAAPPVPPYREQEQRMRASAPIPADDQRGDSLADIRIGQRAAIDAAAVAAHEHHPAVRRQLDRQRWRIACCAAMRCESPTGRVRRRRSPRVRATTRRPAASASSAAVARWVTTMNAPARRERRSSMRRDAGAFMRADWARGALRQSIRRMAEVPTHPVLPHQGRDAATTRRLRQRQPGLHHGVGIERDALDLLLDQPLREIGIVGRTLAADADVACRLSGRRRSRARASP